MRLTLAASFALAALSAQFIVPRPPASSATNPIAASRMPGGDATLPNPSFAASGAGAIPARSTICSTLGTGGGTISTSQSVTYSDINTAIAGCASGQTVLLNPGTYTITDDIFLYSNITLRGSGADQTKLNWTGASTTCGNQQAAVCFNGPNADGTSGVTVVNWTAGFTQGTTQITVDSNTNLAVGKIIVLDADADGTTAASDTWPEIFECTTGGECAVGTGSAASGRANNLKSEAFVVNAFSGSAPNITVTLSRPISTGWFVSATDRKAFWVDNAITSSSQVHDAGVEDLWIDANWSTTVPAIKIAFSRNVWMKGIKVTHDGTGTGNTVITQAYYSSNVTLRDSYIFGGGNVQDNDHYAFACRIGGNHLIENNIFQRVRTSVLFEQCGDVVTAYNYVLHTCAETSGWIFAGIGDNHYNAGMHQLYEGNDGVQVKNETQNGNGQFATLFRNRLDGSDESHATDQSVPVMLYAYNRFNNIIGNVLGTSGYHTRYQHNAGDDHTVGIACSLSIYALGHGGNCELTSGSTTFGDDDQHAVDSDYRWGNWDVVTSTNDNGTNDTTGIKWDNAEVPSGLTKYANPVPANHSLPNSLYLSSKPAFFQSNAWPNIGPDIANGNLTNTGGHANKIPARTCAGTMGLAWGDTTSGTFNRVTCYGS